MPQKSKYITIDEETTILKVESVYYADNIKVYLNGVRQFLGEGYELVGADGKIEIKFDSPVEEGEKVIVDYSTGDANK